MKIDRQIKILLGFVFFSIWLIAGSSVALVAAADDPLGLKRNQAPSKPVFVPKPAGEPVQEQKSSPLPEEIQQAVESEEELERYVTIDFENVDINLFIKYISELTGRNFIIDKSVRGNVTIVSPTKISVEEAYKVF